MPRIYAPTVGQALEPAQPHVFWRLTTARRITCFPQISRHALRTSGNGRSRKTAEATRALSNRR
ncbi:hypothetical protein KCG44_03445 [Pacificimonas sp. WHA3]|uniref:Uncharacterized protein n=1 Tax=Pacificimonas pallii TaxID=2827236 RepID=A0ABS6SBN9_9SPHN|nr:hypothetical protein [Pacificimonas pallii]MBV7255837.1 hypothetical protein [Pacificimonas pallii]